MALMIICVSTAISGTACAVTGAGLTVRTADTLDALLFFLADVKNSAAKDQCHDGNHYEVFHGENYFFSAYSAARDLLVLLIREMITATMAATTIRPGRKPAPKEPVVTRVPI